MLKTVHNPNNIFDRLYKAPSIQESQPSQQAKDIYFINKECKFLTFEEREHVIAFLKNRNYPLMSALADYRANKLNKESLKSALYAILYPKRYAKKTNENLVPPLVNIESKRLSHGGGPVAAGKKSPSALSTRRTINESQTESANHDFLFLPQRASNRPDENDFKEHHKRMGSLNKVGYHRPSFKMSQESATTASQTQSKESKGKLWTSRHQHNPSVSNIKGSTEEYKSHSKKLSEIEKFMQKLEGHAKDSSVILRNITNQVQSPEVYPSVYTLVDTAPSHTPQTLPTMPDTQKTMPNILITDCASPTSFPFMNMNVEESQSSDKTIIRRPQRGRTSDFDAFMKGRLPSSSPMRLNTEDTQAKTVKSVIVPDFTGVTTSSSSIGQEEEEEAVVIVDDDKEQKNDEVVVQEEVEEAQPLDTGRFRNQEEEEEGEGENETQQNKYNVFRGFGGISSTADDMLAESPNFKSPEKDIMEKAITIGKQSKDVEVSEFSSQNNINKTDEIQRGAVTVVDVEDFGFPGELRRNMEALISSKCDLKKPREESSVSPIMGVVPIEESFQDYSYTSSRPVSSNITPTKYNTRSPSPISRGDTRSMMDNSYFSSAKAERYVSISLLKKIFTENGIYAEDIVDEIFRYLSYHTVTKNLFVQILTNYLNQLDVDYGVKTHYIANKIFKICDGNDDKVISYNELGSQLALIAEKKPEKSRARILYETLDAENHDFVTKSDIIKALTKNFNETDLNDNDDNQDNGQIITEKAQTIFKELDKEEKGVVTYWDVTFWKDTEGFEKLYQDLKIGKNTLEALSAKKRAVSITVNPLEEKAQEEDMFDSPPRIEEESNEGTPMTSPQPLRSAIPLSQLSKPVYISHFDFSDSKSPEMEAKRGDVKLDSVRATANFIVADDDEEEEDIPIRDDDTNLLDDINDSPDRTRVSQKREQRDYLVSLPKLNALEASSTEDFNTEDYILESVKIERDVNNQKRSTNRTANTRLDSRSESANSQETCNQKNRTIGTIRTSGTDKENAYYHEDFEFNE